MQITRETNRLIRSMYSTAAVTIFAAAAVVGVQAQSPAAAPAATLTYPALNFHASLTAPFDLTAAAASSDSSGSSSSSSSSSSNSNVDAPDPGASSAAFGASQPPPRRRYGRPTYSDSHTNADGSAKWTFEGGGGFNLPISTTHDDLTTGYRFQVGGGRNFNKKFGVLLQFDYDHFGFQNSTLLRLLNTYNTEIEAYNAANPNNQIPLLTQLGGTSHLWSLTLNPIYNVTQGDKWGTYVVGGVGFYHKVADFTVPTVGEYCDPYYGCYQYQANQVIDSYVSNAPGFNGGGGMTYKFSQFSSMRFFAEARYIFVLNQSRPFSEGGTGPNPNYYNVFPQNSLHTTLIPITFGVRF